MQHQTVCFWGFSANSHVSMRPLASVCNGFLRGNQTLQQSSHLFWATTQQTTAWHSLVWPIAGHRLKPWTIMGQHGFHDRPWHHSPVAPPALAMGCCICGISVRHHSASRLTMHSVAHCATAVEAVPCSCGDTTNLWEDGATRLSICKQQCVDQSCELYLH